MSDILRAVLSRMKAAKSLSDVEDAKNERALLIRWLSEILRDNPHDINYPEIELVAEILSASIE